MKYAAVGTAFSIALLLVAAFILPVQSGTTAVNVGYSATVKVVASHPLYDESGVIVGYKPFYEYESHNLLVDEGKEFIEDQVISASPGANGANYIALSNDGTAPTAGETTCDTEIAANGLSRALGTIVDTGTGTNTVSKTFTATGAQSAQKACLFTDITNGEPDTELAMNTFTSVTLATDDQLTVTWTITIS